MDEKAVAGFLGPVSAFFLCFGTGDDTFIANPR
jgi:hypothetical protein